MQIGTLQLNSDSFDFSVCTVSYTHLDVYKRQLQYCRHANLLLHCKSQGLVSEVRS